MRPLALLLAGVAVIGTLGFLGYFSYARQTRLAAQSAGGVRMELRALHPVAAKYYADHHRRPGVERLRDEHEISSSTRIIDPWGHIFLIACSPERIEVMSVGPDGKKGTDDDIVVSE